MGRRLEFHEKLVDALGSRNVYFQPKTNITMSYPAIRYEKNLEDKLHASNRPYRTTDRYQVIVIDRNPESEIPAKVSALPMCSFSRFYTAEDLNHYVYDVYF